jgi:F-type H+-transporting ATPase subunit a
MNPHSTWFEFLPGYATLHGNLQRYLAREWTWQVFQTTHFQLDHVLGALVVFLFLVFGAVRYRGAVSSAGDAGLLPPSRFGLRGLFEVLADMIFNLMSSVMGEKLARKYLPIIGTFFMFILFANLLALIPGFLPPTDTLKTTLMLSIPIFLLTHYFGVREHGLKYFKHFLGPVWWLAWLMLPIEIVSHIARPVSLAMRLLGNIAADHAVVLAFFAIFPILLPLPFMLMGVFVAVVQAVVFSLLATVYINQAVAHDEH